MKVILIALLAGVFLACVLLERAGRAVEIKELKRRARGTKDSRSAKIYRLAAYGHSLQTFLWLVGGASLSALAVMAADYAWWLAAVVIVVALGLVWPARALSRAEGIAWNTAAVLAGPTAWLVGLLHPVLKRIPGARRSGGRGHTGIYEKDDFLEFINRQNQQPGSRLSEDDLHTAFGALTFADKTVGSVMTPKSRVKMVAVADTIGPHLMDELHNSGFSRFPVVKEAKSANPEIVGILHLYDVVEHAGKGRVRELMKPQVFFINETQNLKETLGAFLRTDHQLLVVVNNFEEIVGIITIEDVLEQILGQKIVDEFEEYDDMRAVANLEVEKDQLSAEGE